MKNLRLVTILVLAVCAFSLAMAQTSGQTRYRFVVKVTSADRNEPIAGANVLIQEYLFEVGPGSSTGHDSAATDEGGMAYLVFQHPATFSIRVISDDYESAEKILQIKGGYRDIPVNFSLRRKGERKVVIVSLTAEDNHEPIPEAGINLKGNRFNAFYKGTTDRNGRAMIDVIEGGDYDVEIVHSKFESINATLNVKGFDDNQKEYSLSYQMKRKKPLQEEQRTLVVTVQARNESGALIPVKYADVTLQNGQSKSTDGYGKCEMKHNFAPGETVRVDVEHSKYNPKTETFIVQTRGQADYLTVTLDSLDAGNYPNLSGSWESKFRADSPWRPTSIEQSGNNLTFHNENVGSATETSKGHFVSSTRIVATDWEGGLGATVTDNGKTINWDNGSVWRRAGGTDPGTVNWVWEQVGAGNCTGLDELPYTDGSSTPDDSRAKEGYTAVCWDNETYINKYRPTKFCTYKKVTYEKCTGASEATGMMYKAVKQ